MSASLLWAVGANVAAAGLGYGARLVSRSGAVGGAVIGTIIYAAAGLGAWVLLLATFAAAVLASRFRLQQKMRLGIAQERGGRRAAANAFANCGVAALAAVISVVTPYGREALVALVAALAAGGSDTVASEIGKACGKSPVLITTLMRVKPGTPGGISVEGTVAGLVAATALASLAALVGLIEWPTTLAIVGGATAGAFVESALGATLEASGILNNDLLNVINTAVAAGIAILLA